VISLSRDCFVSLPLNGAIMRSIREPEVRLRASNSSVLALRPLKVFENSMEAAIFLVLSFVRINSARERMGWGETFPETPSHLFHAAFG
jgi:hypothetical protein